jgi:hypothetical protein
MESPGHDPVRVAHRRLILDGCGVEAEDDSNGGR